MKDKTIVWHGELPISKPGVYEGVPLETYHSQEICPGPSVSSSNLRRVLERNGGSPAHFFCEWSGNPERVEPPEREAWTFGRACHHLMLRQPNFASEFVIRPDKIMDKHRIGIVEWNGNRTECRQWLAQAAAGGARWDADNLAWVPDGTQPPLSVITGAEARHIIGIGKSLMMHPLVHDPEKPGKGILNGHIERSFFWPDKITGLWLKARPDSIPTDSGDYADLKTTTSVQYPDLVNAISKYAYHQQAALIGEGSRVCAGIQMTCFALVFVEKKPPYCVRIGVLRDEHVKLGARQNRMAIDIIASCIKRNRWPGPGDVEIAHLDLSQRYVEEAELNCEAFEKEDMTREEKAS